VWKTAASVFLVDTSLTDSRPTKEGEQVYDGGQWLALGPALLRWIPVLGTNGTENTLKDSPNVFKLGFGFRERPRGTRWQKG
jgi:hypothetical protein